MQETQDIGQVEKLIFGISNRHSVLSLYKSFLSKVKTGHGINRYEYICFVRCRSVFGPIHTPQPSQLLSVIVDGG